jgi:Protein of unknown function (DUF3515)
VKAVPAHVADQDRRQVDAGDGYAAGWGDPAIELRCGVPRPAGSDRLSECTVVDGVGWYLPEADKTGKAGSVTLTTIGRAQNVEVTVPSAYSAAAAMVDLAPAVKRTVRVVRPCV